MLDILIERFNERFVDRHDMEQVEHFLNTEAKLLSSIAHLEEHVVGPPLFEWDYQALGEGFLDLVRPYMHTKPYTSMLFMSALGDLHGDKPKYLPAVLFLEYSHAMSLINDYFNFHEEFTLAHPDRKRCAKLTQLKYAGQYLSMYPRYLLTENRFDLDAPSRVRVYRLLTGISVTFGMSRGVFVKWSHALFQNVTLEQYLQNAVCAVCNYIQFPILLAAALVGVSDEVMTGLRQAFSYLSLFVKIRCEKRVYLRTWVPEPDTVLASSLLLFGFQGYAFLHKKLHLDPSTFADTRYPDIRTIALEIAQSLDGPTDPVLLSDMNSLEEDCYHRFRAELNRLGLLSRTRSLLEQSFGI